MKRRAVRIALIVLLGFGGAFYFLFIGRAHEHLEKEGWVLDWSYVRVSCRHCSSRVERLEHAGTAISPPRITPGSSVVSMQTPVGVFWVYPEHEQWFHTRNPRAVATTGPALEPADLTRGWYEMAESHQPNGLLMQRTATPSHWALVEGFKGRWCEPRLIGECAVAVSQPPATQTCPAG